MKYYDELPEMECLAGDTLPLFHISPKTGSFDGCRMELVIAGEKTPTTPLICKECKADSTGFNVRLTSEDTSLLAEGCYDLHFRLIGREGLSYRKLAGKLVVHKAAEGELP